MTHITCTYIYIHFSCLLSFLITCFFSYHISYTFRVILYCISCSCNCILSSHRSAMLLISYHILYTFLYIYFLFSFMFMPTNTIEVDTRENCMYLKVLSLFSVCMYPKVLSLYKTVISICMYPKVLSLYETMISV